MSNRNPEIENKDYALFLEAETTSSSQPFSKKLEATKFKIQSTLVNSPKRIVQVYVLGSIAGYLASLIFCEQNTVGLGAFAEKTAMAMCAFGMPWCWLICGAIFAAFPLLATAAIFNRFERRYLYRNLWWLVASMPMISSLLMIFVPRGMDEFFKESNQMMMLDSPSAIGFWLLGALGLPYLIEFLLSLNLRQKRWQIQ